MGIRFRRSVKITPGIKLNSNKKSIGLTVGTRGAHMTVNSKGTRTTSVGIPGTGLSYVDIKTAKSKKTNRAFEDDSAYASPPPPSRDEIATIKIERLKSKYSAKSIKRFSIAFIIFGILLAVIGLLLTLATPVGILFLVLGIVLILTGRWYSTIASIGSWESKSKETE